MQNRIVTMDELKVMLDKYLSTNPDLPEIMEEFNDAYNNGCTHALLQFDDNGDTAWYFLDNVTVCDDPNCTIDHSSETALSQNLFDELMEEATNE